MLCSYDDFIVLHRKFISFGPKGRRFNIDKNSIQEILNRINLLESEPMLYKQSLM